MHQLASYNNELDYASYTVIGGNTESLSCEWSESKFMKLKMIY